MTSDKERVISEKGRGVLKLTSKGWTPYMYYMDRTKKKKDEMLSERAQEYMEVLLNMNSEALISPVLICAVSNLTIFCNGSS